MAGTAVPLAEADRVLGFPTPGGLLASPLRAQLHCYRAPGLRSQGWVRTTDLPPRGWVLCLLSYL